jgi:protein ImuA
LSSAGFARGTLHEIYAASAGDGASALGFAALASLRFTAAERPLLWLRRLKSRGAPYAPGLAELGFDPGQILFVNAPDERALLRAGADAAQCAGVGAILIEAEGKLLLYDLTASRRLRLAAARSGVAILIVRAGVAPIPSAAETRWEVAASPSAVMADDEEAPGPPAFAVRLLRRRGGPAGMEFRLEWNRDRACFREKALSGALASLPAGGPAADRATADA